MDVIKYDDKVFAIVDSINNFKPGLEFYGTTSDFIQVGRFRYNKGKNLRNHMHIPRERTAAKTQEIMIVFKGSCEVRTYNQEQQLISAKVLGPGEFYISYLGGCGFTIMEDNTIMMEIKNGPYDVQSDDEDRILL